MTDEEIDKMFKGSVKRLNLQDAKIESGNPKQHSRRKVWQRVLELLRLNLSD
jgi:hypothetical protein